MKSWRKGASVTVIGSMMLAGCVTTGTTPNRPLTAAEQKLRQEAEVYNSTLAEGALIGCGVGLLVGLLNSRENKRTNALVGCAAGGALGLGAGYYIAEKQKQYADTEDQLEAMTADVRQDNERLADMIETTRQVIADDKRRIDQIDAKLAAGQITLAQAKAEMQSVDANTTYLKNTLASLNERKDTYEQALAQTNGPARDRRAMETEITKLEGQIKQLEGELNGLVTRRSVSRVG